MKPSRFLAILLCLMCGAGGIIACGSRVERPNPLAERGVLDLRDWRFDRDGIVPLDGDWEWHTGRFVQPEEFRKATPSPAPQYRRVPHRGLANPTAGRDGAHSHRGFWTWHLRVLLPPDAPALTLAIPHIPNACRVFVNGTPRSLVGRPAASARGTRHALRPQYVDIGAREPVMDLVIHASSYHPAFPYGIWHSVQLGERTRVTAQTMAYTFLHTCMLAVIFIMGFYHLILFVLRRSDRSPLYFGLFCLVISLYLYLHATLYTIHFHGDASLQLLMKLVFLVLFTSVPLFMLYFHSLFVGRRLNAMMLLLLAASLAGIVITFAAGDDLLFSIMVPYQVLAALCSLWSVVTLIRSLKTMRRDAIIMLAGYGFMFAACLYEFLWINLVVPGMSILPLALCLFIVLQSFLLSQRIAGAFNRVAVLSHELEDKNRRLLDLDRLKDEFLAKTSHELRTPLNGIIGIAESLADGMDGELPPRVRDHLSLIVDSGRRLAALVNDILDYARLKNRDLTLDPAPLDLRGAAEVVIALQQPLVGGRDLRLVNAIPTDTPLVWADEGRLIQVLHNLVGNAVKFTERGFVVIAAAPDETGGRPGVRISVADTGPGIPTDQHDRIFMPFEQGDGSSQRRYGGTGLGLSISRHLVELHGGTLELSVNDTAGSTFSFSLPRAERAAVPAGPPAAPPPSLRRSVDLAHGSLPEEAPSGTVLIVDDDPVNLAVAMGYLAREGYAVHTARTGDEALSIITDLEGERRLPFDCILLDVMMPGVSGYELCRHIRTTHSLHELPVLMVTARSGLEDLVLGFEAGANDYITKPLNRPELMVRLKNLVAMKRSAQDQRENRYRMLQDRMKPHFLFNALNSIYFFLKRDAAKASTALLTLADMYRFLTNETGRHLISFDAEWKFACDYLEMQRLQYQGMLDCTMVREGDFGGVMMPPLTIQPLVENAFKHGFGENPVSGYISLTAMRDGGTVVVTIQDNGAGIADAEPVTRTLGNIRQRLAYFYAEADLTLRNRPEGGAMAQLIMGEQRYGTA